MMSNQPHRKDIEAMVEKSRRDREAAKEPTQPGLPATSGGSGLPAGTGQYKVLQLDGDDRPHWDWVRAH